MRASELGLLALALPTLASCGQKLMLYVDAYGQTYLRLLVALVVALVFPLLLLTGLKSTFASWRGYGASVVATLVLGCTFASFLDADAHIVRVHRERIAKGQLVDPEYVSSLQPSPAIRDLRGYRRAPSANDRLPAAR